MYDGERDQQSERPGLVWRWPVVRRRSWPLAHPRALFIAAIVIGVVVLLIIAGSARAL